MKISLTVNDVEYPYTFLDSRITLLYYLRNVLRFTASKNGCNEGHCGSCTVIVDGKAVLACRKFLKNLDAARVTALEFFSNKDHVHSLIYSFAKEGAVQCGFCTPGVIMSAKALLDRNKTPNEIEIAASCKNVGLGLGYALSEEYKQENGKIITDTYAKLGIRRIGKTPGIKCIIIEDPHEEGPYGAKGMGELPLSMGAPSVVHAVYDALGIWVNSIPAVPEKILNELKKI